MTEVPLTLLPRLCPFCGNRTIIGHGGRLKPAHDEWHEQIWIRRGRCRPCQKTFTVLPDWSPPSGTYSLHCRQKAWELLRQSDSNWERSVPDVADASRSPDPSTVRRWAGRLLQLEPCWRRSSGRPLAGVPPRLPPSLPGIGPRSAVFCPGRQEVHDL
ncbi:MAG: DUF6431 domain-containing protein, partial [Acidobacteriia bacterium]|nr:DUF6431 domain-containing protein [Terriglobia bacterium]